MTIREILLLSIVIILMICNIVLLKITSVKGNSPRCKENFLNESRKDVFPIGFSIPESRIRSNVTTKTKWISNLIPGQPSTYIYKKEADYYAEYATSVFAITCQKGGWDCLRHYEILSQGCIPLFIGIERCPKNTMTFFPKKLLARTLEKLLPKMGQPLTEELQEEIRNATTILLEYTRQNLTTRAMAMYLCKKVYLFTPRQVLLISHFPHPDYLRCLTVHGMKCILGSAAHEVPRLDYLYKGADVGGLYGYGFSYTCDFTSDFRDDSRDKTLHEDIASRRYDLIIYPSFCNMEMKRPLWSEVNEKYSPSEIVLLCGNDMCDCKSMATLNGYPMFKREL